MQTKGKLFGFIIILLVILNQTGCVIQPGKDPTHISYNMATTVTINAGELLPGTEIRYVSMDDDGAHLTIGGENASKRKGDSVYWKGTLGSGVTVDERLRVVWYTTDSLTLAGTVKVQIDDIAPSAVTFVPTSTNAISGPEVYSLAKGAKIPGTQLVYEGRTDNGALFSGIDGYAYRQVGDTLIWEGKLREGVYLRFEGRVVMFNKNMIRVAGIVTLWFVS